MQPSTQTKSESRDSGVDSPNALLPSILIYVWMGLWTAAVFALEVIPFLIGLCLPKWQCRWVMRHLALFWGTVIVRCATWPFIRVKRTGEVPIASPALFVCNHRSAFDAFLVAIVGKAMIQGVNDWPLKLPLLGFVARKAGYLDMTNMPFDAICEEIRQAIERGISVVVFPEGHRSGDGPLQNFRSGIFHAARNLGLPIQPIVINGNQRIPDMHFRMASGRIQVEMLPVVTAETVLSFSNAFTLKQHIRMEMQKHGA